MPRLCWWHGRRAAIALSPTPSVTIAKWHNNHAAAISLTYDDQPGADRPIDGLVARPDLNLDYEWVTQHMTGEGLPVWVTHDLTRCIP